MGLSEMEITANNDMEMRFEDFGYVDTERDTQSDKRMKDKNLI